MPKYIASKKATVKYLVCICIYMQLITLLCADRKRDLDQPDGMIRRADNARFHPLVVLLDTALNGTLEEVRQILPLVCTEKLEELLAPLCVGRIVSIAVVSLCGHVLPVPCSVITRIRVPAIEFHHSSDASYRAQAHGESL